MINTIYYWSNKKEYAEPGAKFESRSKTISFSPLKQSDAGQYVCEVTLEMDSNNVTLVGSHNVVIQSGLTLCKQGRYINVEL